MKRCYKCGENKPLADFYIQKRGNKPMSRCKPCGVIQAREWRANNPDFEKNRYQREKLKTREKHLKRKYGVTLANYDEMLKIQNGKCAICGGKEEDQFNQVFHVDHCHKTGSVRGLLCRGCNYVLGTVQDKKEILESAIAYLEKPIVPQVAAQFIKDYL